MKRIALLGIIFLSLAGFIVGQSIKVEVDGKVTEMSAAALAKLPRKEVAGKDHDGKESTFSGVEIREIFLKAGAKMGETIRGKRLAEYLLVEAADGYRAVFAIAELDHEFSADVVILADKQDGKPLDEKNGKFQVIAPADKRHGRWVRQVTALRLKSEPAASHSEKRGDVDDVIRTRVIESFLSFLAKVDTSFREPTVIYLGVDQNKNPSSALISALRRSGRRIEKVSEMGPLRADGSHIEPKKGSLALVLSRIKWVDRETVEVGIWESCGNLCGLGCTYRVLKKNEAWETEGEPSCTVS